MSQERFFRFIRDCGRLLGKSDTEAGALIEDESWFFCFDDGLTPEEAVQEYNRHLKASPEGVGPKTSDP